MSVAEVVEADLTWTGRRFERGLRLAVDADGRIDRVASDGPAADRRLERRAILPGFVNAHSHAFQRGLRGSGESYPEAEGSFWSWREAMYQLVESLDAGSFYDLSRAAFEEMLDAGITAVGEFHYLHHSPTGLDFAFDESILEAAADAGLRIVLLQTAYRTGGVERPLAGAQRRFDTVSSARFEAQLEALSGRLRPATQSFGVAAHSLRAVPAAEVAELAELARGRRLPFHLHLEEQQREIDEVEAATGRRPFELLLAATPPPGTTVVHATHSIAADFDAFGGGVCLCPLTEASLADGVADLPAIDAAGLPVALGTDSNARISMLEEMRWMEYAQRLHLERRGIARDRGGGVAPRLLAAATTAGAASLGLPAGVLEPGRWADFVALDLDHPSLAGADPEELPAALVFGAGDGAIAATAVGGRWRPRRAGGDA